MIPLGMHPQDVQNLKDEIKRRALARLNDDELANLLIDSINDGNHSEVGFIDEEIDRRVTGKAGK